jgi:metallophosphoesterase (TIGR00282 family)
MRILFLGDIVGRSGRTAVKSQIDDIRKRESVDFVFANGENASAGVGLSRKNARELLAAGVDAMTSGNHIWKFKDMYNILETEQRLLRPANYPNGAPGAGIRIIKTQGLPSVALINLQGRTFMPPIDCPFQVVDNILAGLPDDVRIRIVDFHAEATSEKIAMGHFLDGRVSAVLGTHTHVQTNDPRILPKGTAYLTDIGMCGPENSCLGMKVDSIVEKFMTGLPTRFTVVNEPGVLQGAIFDINDSTGAAISIAPWRKDRA